MNYHKRKFKVVSNDQLGEVGDSTHFTYYQINSILWGTYEGGDVVFGTITGLVKEDGTLRFSYQHVNRLGTIRSGKCESVPRISDEGKLRLYENWRWDSDDSKMGSSVIEEI